MRRVTTLRITLPASRPIPPTVSAISRKEAPKAPSAPADGWTGGRGERAGAAGEAAGEVMGGASLVQLPEKVARDRRPVGAGGHAGELVQILHLVGPERLGAGAHPD